MFEGLELHELRSVYDMISLKGKKALITGAAGGIGRSCAAALAEAGADVALMDIPAKLDILERNCAFISDKFSRSAIPITGDVSDPDSVKEIFNTIEAKFGTIDVVFSNAGILAKNDSASIALADWKRALDVNLTGMFLIDQAAADMMVKHGHGGSIINTASMSGSIVNRTASGNTAMVAYTSTKAAVAHLTKSMAINYIDKCVRFNSISPGYAFSGLHVHIPKERIEYMESTIPLGRFGTLNEIVGAVLFLASDLGSYCIGTDLLVDGGYAIW